jgi:hypothetical protein
MPSKPKYREVTDPAISANQLADYLTATPHGRKRIIQSARWQSTAVVARYKHARAAIGACLCDATKSPTTYGKQRAALQERLANAQSAWERSDLEASVEALDRYNATLNITGANKLECTAVAGSVPQLIIGGLRVRVTPDVTITRNDPKDSAPHVGAVLAMIAKGENSGNKRKEKAKTAAVLVWLFAEQYLSSKGIPDRKLCYAFDVFDGNLVAAGSSIATRVNNITAACEEIAHGWAKATPPDDIDT